jgi:MFS family permease
MNASAMSLFRMLGDIGYVVGPVILGFIVDTQGTDMALYLAAIILSVIGASFARFAPESYRPKR